MKKLDLSNMKFGKLSVIKFSHKSSSGQNIWECIYDCGNYTNVQLGNLRSGATTSCGCFFKEKIKEKNSKHGEYVNNKTSPEMLAFIAAKKRCNNINNHNYKNYGKRGIKFLFSSFEDFLQEIGRKPNNEYSLERIDNNKHYEIGNIEWAINFKQQNNKRTNCHLSFNKEIHTYAEWSRIININEDTISRRKERGWCDYCTITIRPRKGTCIHK